MSPTATIRLRQTSGAVVVVVGNGSVERSKTVVLGCTIGSVDVVPTVVLVEVSAGTVTSAVHDASKTGSINHFRLTIPIRLQQGRCYRGVL